MAKIKSCDGQGCKERKACLRLPCRIQRVTDITFHKACYYTRPNGRDCPIMIKQVTI